MMRTIIKRIQFAIYLLIKPNTQYKKNRKARAHGIGGKHHQIDWRPSVGVRRDFLTLRNAHVGRPGLEIGNYTDSHHVEVRGTRRHAQIAPRFKWRYMHTSPMGPSINSTPEIHR